jgi:hypothetical protein
MMITISDPAVEDDPTFVAAAVLESGADRDLAFRGIRSRPKHE